MFLKFIDLIKFLDKKLKTTKIVVRPHPVENLESYKKLLKNCKKVVIDNTGYIIPWIKASSIVIQNGCQTGLEAYGLDKPVLTYAPFSRGKFTTMKKTVPGKISKKIKNKELVLKFLLSKSSKKAKKINKKIFDFRFYKSKKLSSENIVRVLQKVKIEKNNSNINLFETKIKDARSKFRNIFDFFQQSRLYLRKNKKVKLSELIKLKKDFSKYRDFRKIKIIKIYDGLYQIDNLP